MDLRLATVHRRVFQDIYASIGEYEVVCLLSADPTVSITQAVLKLRGSGWELDTAPELVFVVVYPERGAKNYGFFVIKLALGV